MSALETSLDLAMGRLETNVLKLASDRTLLLAACEEALDYFEDHSDTVDGPYGEPQPNSAMHMAEAMRAAIFQARRQT